jgi:hypothetical protein
MKIKFFSAGEKKKEEKTCTGVDHAVQQTSAVK